MSTQTAKPGTLRSNVLTAAAYLVPVMLGVGLLALVGFAPYPAVHDAFHDIRHAAGFPCH